MCLLTGASALLSCLTSGSSVPAVALSLAAGLFALGALWRSEGPSEATWHRSGLVLLGFVGALSVTWAAVYSSVQGSDFGVYWRCGTDDAVSLANLMEACRSKYISMERIYGERSLFYTMPFGALFGANYALFKLYNAALHIATAATLWVATGRIAGPRAAFIAVGVLSATPEWWFTLTMAAPDNLALLAVAVIILAVAELGATRRAVAWTVVLALAMLVAQWSRSLGVLALGASLAASLLAPNGAERRRHALLASAAALLYLASSSLLNLLLGGPKSQVTLLATISALDLASEQQFAVGFEWLEHLWRALPEAARTRVAVHRIAEELLLEWQRWPAYMADKARVLFQGDGYLFFATWGSGDNLDSAFPVAVSDVPRAPWIFAAARAAPIASLVLMIGALAKGGFDRAGRSALAFAALFFALILGFAEAQARYAVIVAPAVGVLVASAFRRDRQTQGRAHPAPLLLGVMVISSLWIAGVLVTTAVRHGDRAGLDAARQGSASVVAGAECNAAPISISSSRRIARVALPAGESCASVVVPISGSQARRASFFVTTETLPFAFEQLPPAGFRYGYRTGAGAFRWEDLDTTAARWHELPLDDVPGARELEIAVMRTSASGAITVHLRDVQAWR